MENGRCLFWTTWAEAEAFAKKLNEAAVGKHEPLYSDEMPFVVAGPFDDDMLKNFTRDL